MPVLKLPLLRERREVGPPDSAPLSPAPLTARLTRTEPLRCLLWSLGAMLVGLLLSQGLLPLPDIEEILVAHLAGRTFPAVFWLRLTVARLPMLMLLSLAGLTRLSGGISTAVLIARGISDGIVLGCLSSLTGATALAVSHSRLMGAYAVWMLFDLTARLATAISARRLAKDTVWQERDRLVSRLWRHGAITLAALCTGALGAGIYTLILTHT